ncbi:MAG: hypothetical protein ACE5ET_03775 [Gammaproteobacteria bacterium]
MTIAHKPPYVGSPDPELKTSPIVEAMDEAAGEIMPELEDYPVCYFNNVSYQEGTYVCSGSGELLHCEKGVWVQAGSCDPDNP